MENKVKLIWQFSGMDALKIADHHLVHLNTYVVREKIEVIQKGTELINEFSAISFVVIPDNFLESLRLNLKPHQIIKDLIVEE